MNQATAFPTRPRFNAITAMVLVAIVALAPIPLGSNRPAFWMIWAVIVGLVGLGYGLSLMRFASAPRLTLRLLLPETLLFGLVLCYLVVQMLPLGGAPVLLQNGTVIAPPAISLDPGSTLLEAIVLATYGVMFFLFAQVANPVRARRLLVAMFAIIVAFAVYGLVSLTQLDDTLLGFEKLFYRGYATATFVNRNSYATFLAAGIAIGVALIACCFADKAPSRTTRWLRIAPIVVGIVLILAALLASASRMGAAAAMLGAGVAFLAATSGRRDAVKLRLAFVTAAAIVVITPFALYGGDLVDRIVLVGNEGRLQLYAQVWDAIMQRPWLGYGGGSFAAVFPVFQQPPLDGGVVWDRAHCSYLTLWFELGLIFGSLPLLILASLGWRAWRALGDPAHRLPAAAALGVLMVFAAHSLVDFSAEIEANAFLFIAVLALPAAGRKRKPANGR